MKIKMKMKGRLGGFLDEDEGESSGAPGGGDGTGGLGGVSGPRATTLGEIAATGRNGIVAIVAPNVPVVA